MNNVSVHLNTCVGSTIRITVEHDSPEGITISGFGKDLYAAIQDLLASVATTDLIDPIWNKPASLPFLSKVKLEKRPNNNGNAFNGPVKTQPMI